MRPCAVEAADALFAEHDTSGSGAVSVRELQVQPCGSIAEKHVAVYAKCTARSAVTYGTTNAHAHAYGCLPGDLGCVHLLRGTECARRVTV